MHADTRRTLTALAAATHSGLLTRAQLQTVSVPKSWLRTQLRTGTLQRVEADVFALRAPWGNAAELPWATLALAACLQRGPEARLAYGTAARIWGLAEGQAPLSGPLHVLVPAARGLRSTRGVRVHRTNRLTSSDVTSIAGLPITTVARTIIDLAWVMDPDSVERIVDDALVRRLTTVPLLSGAVQRNVHRGCRGGPVVRAALSLWSAGPLESHAETEVLRWLLGAGVPEPVRQLEVVVPGGRRLRVDLAWPEARVALEVDGFAHHHGPRQLSADHERRSVLTSLGWSVLTTTVAEVRRGGASLVAALRTLGVMAGS